MDQYELDFCRIILLRENIAEVIVNEGVEMDERMVDDYHALLCAKLSAPFSLLINKLNAYTYNFAAQKKLATIPQVHAMAVLVYNRISEASTEALIRLPREVDWNIRVMHDREGALSWLNSQQALVADAGDNDA